MILCIMISEGNKFYRFWFFCLCRLTEINSREYLEDFEAKLRQPLQGVDNDIDVVLV